MQSLDEVFHNGFLLFRGVHNPLIDKCFPTTIVLHARIQIVFRNAIRIFEKDHIQTYSNKIWTCYKVWMDVNVYAGNSPVIEAIEVLITKKAYYVKRVGAGEISDDQSQGQITWSMNGGPQLAWEAAKKRANY